MTIIENNIALKKPNERLRYLRTLTKLDRTAISMKYNIPEVTLRFWETGKAPLTKKGISRCLDIYHKEGIRVTEEWLSNGFGDLPHLDPLLMTLSNVSNLQNEFKINIQQDLNYFKNTYSNCIFFEIKDNEMLPIYKKGDFIICKISNHDLKLLNQKDCIVFLESNEIIFRRVFISEQDKMSLNCTNPFSSIPIIFDVQPKAIAPIIVHYIL